ncbi:MAG: hypothetical protein JRJ87_13945 [Deltaproteobacteria bacterium]|nr:hypothetical protein [Deltaproteobacteria bacterium]
MWRVFVMVGILFCGGILSAANIIVGKKPNAKELIDKLVPYQGWIGAVMFLWGIWDFIYMFNIIGAFSFMPVTVLVLVAATLTELVLGFLLGFGLITKYALSKSEAAMEKGQAIRAKLSKFQGPLGIVAIVIAAYILIANIFHIVI